jgi:hypothetical protein
MLDAVPPPGSEHSPERLKDRLRGLLKAGAGSLVVASAVVMTAPSAAAIRPPSGTIVERVEALRARLAIDRLMPPPGDRRQPRLAWHAWHDWQDYADHDQVWNNVSSWHNLGYQDPRWGNWGNWHDWHDWNDWNNRY